MAFDLTKPDGNEATWPVYDGEIRENIRAIVQGDANVFTKIRADIAGSTTAPGTIALQLNNTNGVANAKWGVTFTTSSFVGSAFVGCNLDSGGATASLLFFTGGATPTERARFDGVNGFFGIAAAPVARLHVGAGGTGSQVEEIRIDSGSASGGHAYLQVMRNSVQKALIGVSGSAAALIAGDAVNDLAIKSAQTINFSADSGTTKHASMSGAGAWTFTAAAATSTTQNYGGTTTAYHALRMQNTAGDVSFGVNDASGAWMTGTAYGGFIDVVANKPLEFGTNNTLRGRISAAGSWVFGTAALTTTATDGFVYVPSCAGAPTGTPTAFTGMIALVYDSTNNKLYAYNGAWKSVTLA